MKSQFLSVSSSLKTGCAPSRPNRIDHGIPLLAGFSFGRAALCLIFLLMTITASRATTCPPVLVLNGTGYGATAVSGVPTSKYYTVTGKGVLVLSGTTAVVNWGSNLNAALHSPSEIGSWDGAMTVTLAGFTIIVPEVLVYYSSWAMPTAPLQAYDGSVHYPKCSNAIGSSLVQAFSGLPDGAFFNFGNGLPCYLYSSLLK